MPSRPTMAATAGGAGAVDPRNEWRRGCRPRRWHSAADFAEIDFIPVRIDDFEADDDGGLRSFAIIFRPKPEMLKKANEPLYIMRELRKLGELELVADTGALPHLSDLNHDHPYIGWTGTLRTTAAISAVSRCFRVCRRRLRTRDHRARSGAWLRGGWRSVRRPIVAERAGSGGFAGRLPSMPPRRRLRTTGARATKPARHHDAGRSRQDRSRRQHGGRTGDCAGHARPDRAGPLRGSGGRLSQMLDEVIHHTRELKDSVMSMRAQPVASVFQRMPRLVRELSAKTAKKVRLEMVGETHRGRPHRSSSGSAIR